MNTAKELIKSMHILGKKAKAIIGIEVERGRILPSVELVYAIDSLLREVGSDIATMENDMRQFGRQSVGAKRFIVREKAEVN
jgi:hypothetical protein